MCIGKHGSQMVVSIVKQRKIGCKLFFHSLNKDIKITISRENLTKVPFLNEFLILKGL